jgi:hypothetical protein
VIPDALRIQAHDRHDSADHAQNNKAQEDEKNAFHTVHLPVKFSGCGTAPSHTASDVFLCIYTLLL